MRFTVCSFRDRVSVCMCASFPFGFEGRIWNLIGLVPDYCPFTLYFAWGPAKLEQMQY